MNKLLTLLAIGALMAMATASFATGVNATATSSFNTDVNEMAVLAIAGTAGDLVLAAPTIGGAAIVAVPSATTYAQYTSVITSGKTRILDAAITTGTIPAGTTLQLTAGTTAGTGNVGITAGQVTLTSTAASIVTGIGSCNTGTTATSGTNLSYVLSVSAIGSLVTTATNNITVTFTLNDGA
jgi:hypothetical protein